MKKLVKWFSNQRKNLAIDVVEIPLSKSKDWMVVKKNGKPDFIAHQSGKYHKGVALKAFDPNRGIYVDRFLLSPIPPQKGEKLYGVALLASYKNKYLVQAKSEPGNATLGHVQITSTIHSSYTNIEMKLSGEVPFTWMYDEPKCIKFIVSQDGAQLYMKNNKVCFLYLDKDIKDIPQNFTWMTKKELSFFASKGLVSEHVMQCLGVSILI